MKRLWVLSPLAVLLLSPVSTFALSGEASAVIQHCGTPSSDVQGHSEVTGTLQRNLTYGNTILRFNEVAGDWSYASAWRGHLPVGLSAVEAALPCVGDALNQAAKAPTFIADPTIVTDQTAARNQGLQFGRPFLWLIGLMAAFLVISMAIPGTRRRMIRRPPMQDRPFRRPQAKGFRFARRATRPASTRGV